MSIPVRFPRALTSCLSIVRHLSRVVCCLLYLCACHAKATQIAPNVVMIYTDDHRYSGIHALGGMDVRTPNLDDLIAHGSVFTRTYLQGAFVGATCMPSRAMLITGRGLFDLDRTGHHIPETHTMMGEAFRNAGYATYHVGKWHQDHAALARSAEDGACVMGLGVYLVDHFRMPLWDWDSSGIFPPEKAYLLKYASDGQVERRAVMSKDTKGPTGTEADGPHTSEIFADKACDYISNYHENKPFFMYLAFHAPHDPRQAPQAYRDMYPPENVKLSPSYMPQHPFDNGHMFLRDEELAPWPRTEEVAKQHLADYCAIITHLDAQIGRVIQSLKDSGLYENTIIVISGDSGLAVGNHGLMGKQNIYDEDGIHVPWILVGKGIPIGARLDGLAYIHDIFPTLCDLTGIPVPSSVTGVSHLSEIQGGVFVRDHTFHAYRQHQRAYRKEDYKMIEYVRAPDGKGGKNDSRWTGSRVTQLFNIRKDPWETQDLSFLPENQELLEKLRGEMKQEANRLGDSKSTTGELYDFWDYYN